LNVEEDDDVKFANNPFDDVSPSNTGDDSIVADKTLVEDHHASEDSEKFSLKALLGVDASGDDESTQVTPSAGNKTDKLRR
jgi:hypothetical protein